MAIQAGRETMGTRQSRVIGASHPFATNQARVGGPSYAQVCYW